MEIEYDPAKAESNVTKHGISFKEAESALLDPNALAFEDHDAEGEPRWILLGMSDQARLLTIVYTLHGEDRIRLVSARKATRREMSTMRNEYDFSNAKRAKDIPHLVKHQQEVNGKARITIMLDNDVLSFFRAHAEKEGIGYQTLINAALRKAIDSQPVDEATLRRVLREELEAS